MTDFGRAVGFQMSQAASGKSSDMPRKTLAISATIVQATRKATDFAGSGSLTGFQMEQTAIAKIGSPTRQKILRNPSIPPPNHAAGSNRQTSTSVASNSSRRNSTTAEHESAAP